MSDYYKRVFIGDLIPKPYAIKICVTGMVTNVKIREKVVSFTVDDNTGVLDCLLFKSYEIKNDITVGSLVSLIGEYETEIYMQESLTRLKVIKFSLITDINEELHNYLATFVDMQLQKEKVHPVKIKQEDIEEEGDSNTSSEKVQVRIPLPKETLNLKLRTNIFKCLRNHSLKSPSDQQPYVTFTDILTYTPLIDFCKKEGADLKQDLENIMISLEIIGLVTAIFEHSQNEVEGTKYMINSKAVNKVDEFMLNIIKNAEGQGIGIDPLFKELNAMYDHETFILSKEYIWELANDLFEKNLIYLSKKNVFHYMEKLF